MTSLRAILPGLRPDLDPSTTIMLPRKLVVWLQQLPALLATLLSDPPASLIALDARDGAELTPYPNPSDGASASKSGLPRPTEDIVVHPSAPKTPPSQDHHPRASAATIAGALFAFVQAIPVAPYVDGGMRILEPCAIGIFLRAVAAVRVAMSHVLVTCAPERAREAAAQHCADAEPLIPLRVRCKVGIPSVAATSAIFVARGADVSSLLVDGVIHDEPVWPARARSLLLCASLGTALTQVRVATNVSHWFHMACASLSNPRLVVSTHSWASEWARAALDVAGVHAS